MQVKLFKRFLIRNCLRRQPCWSLTPLSLWCCSTKVTELLKDEYFHFRGSWLQSTVLRLWMLMVINPMILSWAATENRVVVTADLDFGTAVAMRGLSAPSIVQLRTPSTDPQVVGAALRRALRVAGSSLSGGAILTVSHGHVRFRPGPGLVSLTEDF